MIYTVKFEHQARTSLNFSRKNPYPVGLFQELTGIRAVKFEHRTEWLRPFSKKSLHSKIKSVKFQHRARTNLKLSRKVLAFED